MARAGPVGAPAGSLGPPPPPFPAQFAAVGELAIVGYLSAPKFSRLRHMHTVAIGKLAIANDRPFTSFIKAAIDRSRLV